MVPPASELPRKKPKSLFVILTGQHLELFNQCHQVSSEGTHPPLSAPTGFLAGSGAAPAATASRRAAEVVKVRSGAVPVLNVRAPYDSILEAILVAVLLADRDEFEEDLEWERKKNSKKNF